MSYNYNPLFQNAQKVSSQNSIYNMHPSSLRPLNLSINRYTTSNQNQSNSPYIRFIPVANGKSSSKPSPHLTNTSQNRLSMYNYDHYAPESAHFHHHSTSVSRKNSFENTNFQKFPPYTPESACNVRYITSSFGSLSPKTPSTTLNNPKRASTNFSSLNASKKESNVNTHSLKSPSAVQGFYLKKEGSVYSSAGESSSISSDPEYDQCKNKSNKQIKPKTTSLKPKESYDNHHYVYNHYQINTGGLYLKQANKSNNLRELISDIKNINNNNINNNPDEPGANNKYNKFSFYNKIEENYLSDDSINKLNTNIEGLKNFFNKTTSLYYDSGIGADVSQKQTTNGIKNRSQSQCNKNNDTSINNKCVNLNRNLTNISLNKEALNKSFTLKKPFQSETLNPNMVRNIAKLASSSSFSSSHSSSSSTSSTSPSSSPLSSTYSSGSQNKQRKRLDSLFQSISCKEPIKFNSDSVKTKKLEESELNFVDKKLQADFTPQLIKNSGLKNSSSLIRKLKVPPPPCLNNIKISNTYPSKGQSYPYMNSYDNKINIKNHNNNVSSNLSSVADDYYLTPLLYGKNSRAESRNSCTSRANNSSIASQIYSSARIKNVGPKNILYYRYLLHKIAGNLTFFKIFEDFQEN